MHLVSWSSHKSKRPLRSIGFAEFFAASEAVDKSKVLKASFSLHLGMKIPLYIVLYSKDLYILLYTCHNSIDRSIGADVNVIHFKYEVGNVDAMYWLSSPVNIADPSTKPDSPLYQSLKLHMHTSVTPLDLFRHESRRFDRHLGEFGLTTRLIWKLMLYVISVLRLFASHLLGIACYTACSSALLTLLSTLHSPCTLLHVPRAFKHI